MGPSGRSSQGLPLKKHRKESGHVSAVVVVVEQTGQMAAGRISPEGPHHGYVPLLALMPSRSEVENLPEAGEDPEPRIPGIAQALRGDEKITARRGQAELDDGREVLSRTPIADAAESVLCAGLGRDHLRLRSLLRVPPSSALASQSACYLQQTAGLVQVELAVAHASVVWLKPRLCCIGNRNAAKE